MYPAPSQRFIPALAHSHVPVSVVELYWPDGRVTELAHTGGSVTADRGATIRRTATVELNDPALLPRTAADYLTISGARLRILRGIRYQDGTVETAPLFFGRLDSIEGDPDTGPLTLSASGLEAVIADDKFTAAYSTRGATAAVTAITALIHASLPDALITSTAADTPLGTRTWNAQDDRWAAVQELATAVGAEAYADAEGTFHIAELPAPTTAEVSWEVAAGEGGALIAATTGWARQGLYNSVTAQGENTEDDAPPVSATVEDTDPTSPTYVAGPFGRVPSFYSSPTLTTTAQCMSAATKLLRDAVKPAATADITALPNPLLEPGDILRAVYPDGSRTLHQIQSLSIDLSPGGDFTLTMIGGKEDA